MKLMGYFGEETIFFFNAFLAFFFLGISLIIVEKNKHYLHEWEPPPLRLAYWRGRVLHVTET